jgi:AcrR family transcriptional regulator
VTSVGLRERKKEKTRDALVQSALKQFAKRGFDQVTVEDIADACDVSPRTFFRYFASKEDVLFAESDGHRLRLLTSLADQDAGMSAFAALESGMRMVAAEYTEQRDTIRIRHRIMTTTPSLSTRVAERQQGWESDVVDHLRASRRAKRMSDLDLRLLVASMTTALRVAVESWLAIDAAPSDLDCRLDTVFKRLHDGFGR